MIKYFAFGLGYVEESLLTYLFLEHGEGFETVMGALQDLVEVLRPFSETPLNPCCESRVGTKDLYCSQCGRPLEQLPLDFGDVVAKLFQATTDECARILDSLEESDWYLTSVSPENLAEAVFVGDLARVLQTVYGEEGDITELLPDGAASIRGMVATFSKDFWSEGRRFQ